jgi:hypothetical protein
MGSFNLLLDAPAIPKILRSLLERNEGSDESAVISILPNETFTRKAIEILLAYGVIKKEEGVLRIAEGGENRRRVSDIIEFYQNIDRVTRRRLLFRGILNCTNYKCLIHFSIFLKLMEDEGFDKTEVEALLEKERKEGYVERLKIMYRAREGLKHKCFPFIPLYYYPHFIIMNSDNTDQLKSRLKGAGVLLMEEEYLLGHYPKEIADQSRDYIGRERNFIREKIKNEAFDIWWYYRF